MVQIKPFRRLVRLRVRAYGTASYVTRDGMAGPAFAEPREFGTVWDAEQTFLRIAPKGWQPVVEEVPVKLGRYGTGVIASDHEQTSQTPDS